MSTLFTYMEQTQRFLKDQRQFAENPRDLVSYINRARREVAGATMCVRRLTPISGSILDAQVTAGGHNYSAQTTVTITSPDFPSGQLPYPSGLQATATPIINSGVINNVDISNAGAGYFNPIATVTDPTGAGSGAQVSLTLTPINVVNINQEVYPFSGINVSMFPGVASVYMIRSVSMIYANYRYSLPCYSFSVYQAMIRQYPFQYTYVPTFCSQFGQGADGSFFLYPWPSQTYQIEYDCSCLPQDLTIDNRTPDVIPAPWDDVVPYFAAHLAYLEQQNFNGAKFYLDLFDKMTFRKSGYARPGKMSNVYGRW